MKITAAFAALLPWSHAVAGNVGPNRVVFVVTTPKMVP
jgi:hypothetical protein